jgi:hypothetical protein
VVLAVEPGGVVEVRFDELVGATKRLSLEYAPLRKL